MQRFLSANDPLLVFIGPSGAGKTTIVNRLVELGSIELTPTWTDRPKRSGEEDGREHVFASSQVFDSLWHKGFFVDEPMTFFGLSYRYGLPKIARPMGGKVPAFMGRIIVVPRLESLYPNRIIYQIESSRELVKRRLSSREDAKSLGTRLSDYHAEIKAGRQVARRCFRNDGELESVVRQVVRALHEDFKI